MQCSPCEISNTLAVEYDSDAAAIHHLLTTDGTLSRILTTEQRYGQALLREQLWATAQRDGKTTQWLGTQYLDLGREPTDQRLLALLQHLEKLQKTDPAKIRALALELGGGALPS